ncbi:uncharacterized protein LTR77_006657 [Saxophila tyrrhenica]|uniref:Uncharacterized protein n=1 Tax=Saxophila tyrrhenica TaxID=1690608 RepID=A0AAV9P5E6_9PEZI|nr:hypothetical protein LTR77_006657 [Saxophila tyrrhenica]
MKQQERWQRLVWFSRRGDDVEPTELLQKIRSVNILIGDTAQLDNGEYKDNISDWKGVTDRCILKKRNREPVTQFVFGHNEQDDKIYRMLNSLERNTSIRDDRNPNQILPPKATAT